MALSEAGEKIAGHVDAALAKHAPRDGMRYSPTQKAAMASAYAGRASRANG